MSSGDERDVAPSSEEQRLRIELRKVAGFTLLGLIVFLVVADTLGRLIGGGTFRVSEFIFGSILGVLGLLAGVEVSRVVGRK